MIQSVISQVATCGIYTKRKIDPASFVSVYFYYFLLL